MYLKLKPAARNALALACISALALSSCGRSIEENKNIVTTTSATEVTQTTTPEAEPAQLVMTTIPEREPEAEEVKYEKFSKTVEAELSAYTGKKLKVAKKRSGYKGDGYLTGFKEEGDKVSIALDIPKSQYYTITVRAASDDGARCLAGINGEIRAISIDSKEFAGFEIPNLYIEEGALSIDLSFLEGSMDIDRVTVKASDEIEKLDLTLKTAELSNKNADSSARALYEYIRENFGKNIILGQYDSIGTTIESDAIYKMTGKYPAIRFGDMMQLTTDNTTLAQADLERSIQWSKDGGIVGLMWHWYAPTGKDDYYAENTEFDLSAAVAKIKVAQMTPEEIAKNVEDGKITQECADIIADIDLISENLKVLQSEGIAVLWRPLHEASNGYFWWGHDEESYIWLWQLMYNRMTDYHGLNNLIWVWSAQNAKWYVGDDYCDILSVDIYDKGNLSGQTDRLMFLRSINQKKPLAMSECGNFPAINNAVRDKAMWSYIGQWGGNFLLDENGGLEEGFNTRENLLDVYNNSRTITREELPDFKTLAAEIDEADKAKAEKKDEKEKDKSDADDKKDDKKTDESSEKSEDEKADE